MIGYDIRKRREALGLSQYVLAKEAGIPQQSLSAIETGSIPNPGALTLAKLCQALGCTMEEMLGMDAPGKAGEKEGGE